MNIYTWIMLVSLLCLTACESFLDVQPKGQVDEDEMFKDAEGYRNAIYGVYASLAKEGLYGKVLSYGFLDELAQLYDNNLPSERDNIQEVLAYKYKDPKVVEVVDNIWSKAYECIAYVNNIIAHLEKENLKTDPDFPYILGESYGLRAFIHFDVLRLFADNILMKKDAGGIPYAYDFDLKNKQVFSLHACYENILKDLDEAERLLVACELENDEGYRTIYQDNRFLHLNVYAVYAIKARVLQAMGDHKKARDYAEKVILSSKFSLIKSGNDLDNVMKLRIPAGSELIWGLYNNTLYQTIYGAFLSTDILADSRRVRLDIENIYETSTYTPTNTDFRYQKFFRGSAPALFIRLLEREAKGTDDIATMVLGVNLLRLPEMYYIAAEGWYNEDKEKAIAYLDAVRNSRGLENVAIDKVNDEAGFMDVLRNERIKELWGEGQIFFDYKRYNIGFKAVDMSLIAPSAEIFNLPWPEKELEYGSTYK